MVLESTGEKTFKMMLDLLKSLSRSSVITMDQMKRVRMAFKERWARSSSSFYFLLNAICNLLHLSLRCVAFTLSTGQSN